MTLDSQLSFLSVLICVNLRLKNFSTVFYLYVFPICVLCALAPSPKRYGASATVVKIYFFFLFNSRLSPLDSRRFSTSSAVKNYSITLFRTPHSELRTAYSALRTQHSRLSQDLTFGSLLLKNKGVSNSQVFLIAKLTLDRLVSNVQRWELMDEKTYPSPTQA